MIIAIEKGLEGLKKQLESRGFQCFYIGEGGVADAVIYKDKDSHPYFEVNKSPMMSKYNSLNSTLPGALLINAENKSVDEIIRILTTRTYSPLF